MEHRVDVADRRQQAGHQVRTQSRYDAKTQRAVHRVMALAREFADLPHYAQRHSGALDDLLADRRRHQLMLVALEQSYAEVVFQFFQLVTDRRLGHMAGFRGTNELPLIGQRDQIAQLLQGHGSPRRSVFTLSITMATALPE